MGLQNHLKFMSMVLSLFIMLDHVTHDDYGFPLPYKCFYTLTIWPWVSQIKINLIFSVLSLLIKVTTSKSTLHHSTVLHHGIFLLDFESVWVFCSQQLLPHFHDLNLQLLGLIPPSLMTIYACQISHA